MTNQEHFENELSGYLDLLVSLGMKLQRDYDKVHNDKECILKKKERNKTQRLINNTKYHIKKMLLNNLK